MTDDIRPPVTQRPCAAGRRKIFAFSLTAIVFAALPGWAQTDKKPFSPTELDQILAPIALYSDPLLSQVLMASTYPLEIVEAGRWSQANPTLKGDAAVGAVKDKSWDVSVKSLVAFPTVLSQLSEHLDWTQKLGDAMIGQQQDVAASIQRLRAKAADAGTLKSGKEQTVTIETQGSERIIALAPTDPELVYVPSYDPNTAYGSWPYPSSPPTYYPWGGALLTGLTWGVGIAAAGAMFGGWNWGYGGAGSYNNINVNKAVNIDRNFNRNNIGTGGRWQHDVDHRKGVAYRDNATRQQFGQNRPGADQREQFRGQLQQGSRPGDGLGGGGPRPGGGADNRPGAGAGQRPGGGAGVGQRPGGGAGAGQRPGVAQPRAPGNTSGFSGVNRGQQVNREAQRGRAQQQRAAAPRAGGGGGGRPAGGGGGGRGGGGGGGGGGRAGGGGGGGGRGGGGGGGGGGRR